MDQRLPTMIKKSKKQELHEKITNLKNDMPELQEINWSKLIGNNPEILETIVSGIVKVDGQHRKVANADRSRRINQMYSQEFSEKKFKDAFIILCGKDSLRITANKTNISYSHIFQLKSGNANPTIPMMESIASAYNRQPSYFLEYRIHFILESMSNFLSQNPEIATTWFGKAKGIAIK